MQQEHTVKANERLLQCPLKIFFSEGLLKSTTKSTTKPKKKPAKLVAMRVSSLYLAGPVRFELTMGFPTPVFKTGAFNRSATDPGCLQAKFYQLASLFGGRGRRGPPAARARNGLAPPLPAGR